MRYRSLQLCLAVGAFAAGSALASTTTDSFAFITGGSRIGLLFSGGAVGVTLGAFIAAVVAWGVRVPSHRALAAAVGLVLMGLSAAPWGGEYGVFAAASGAGLLLGALAATVPSLAAGHGQIAVAAGALAGILCAEPLARLGRESSPRRYADYLPASSEPDVVLLVLVAAAVLAVFVLMWQADTGTAPTEDVRLRGRGVLVGLVLPAVWLILHWRFVGSVSGLHGTTVFTGWWWGGLALIPVTLAVAAWIPGPAAAVLLAGTAVAFAGPSELAWYTERWWTLLLPVVPAALGSVVGIRVRCPWFGIVGLVVVAMTGLVESPAGDNIHRVAVLVLFPLAAAFLIASCLPSEPTIAVTALMAPAAILVPLSAKYGWTAYAPLQGKGIAATSSDGHRVSVMVVGVSIVVLGMGIDWLRRRPAGAPNNPGDDVTAEP